MICINLGFLAQELFQGFEAVLGTKSEDKGASENSFVQPLLMVLGFYKKSKKENDAQLIFIFSLCSCCVEH